MALINKLRARLRGKGPCDSQGTRSRRSRSRGYTVVEVLSAMTLFAIGASGVIAMQRVTIQGGDDARRMDVATNIANEWAFRLQRDSAYWTKPNNTDTSSNLNETQWLNNVTSAASKAPTKWLEASQALGSQGMSGDFDLYGEDRSPTDGDHIFCVQYRLQWIISQGAAAPFNAEAAMRADVRVFWARLDQAPILKCEGTIPDPDATTKLNYHFVYTSTVLRPHAAD